MSKDYYERQYADGGEYHSTYSQIPQHAVAMNRYCAALVVTLLDLPPGARVLDLGSGYGAMLLAWRDLGYEMRGLEISEAAAHDSVLSKHIDVGDATDLSRYADGAFDLVFSSQLFEHLTDEQVTRIMEQQFRVGRYGAHFIAHEVGNDPGHINIKSVQGWVDLFARFGHSFAFGNPLVANAPAFVQLRDAWPTAVSHSAHYGLYCRDAS